MKTIRSKTGKRKAIISGGNPKFHVTFWINDEQISRLKKSVMLKTEAGALRAAQKWTA